jgi:putative flippase GtrA
LFNLVGRIAPERRAAKPERNRGGSSIDPQDQERLCRKKSRSLKVEWGWNLTPMHILVGGFGVDETISISQECEAKVVMELGEMQAPPGVSARRRAWFAEAARMLRFGVVGLTATATHYAVALALALGAGAPVQLAHVAGFLAAVPVSFLGHYHWTFRSRAGLGRAARRFVAVALGAFLTSAAVLEALTRLTAWGDAVGILIGVVVIPVASYVINRVFVFRTDQ